MLSRRLLRVKVLQAVYAYYQSDDTTLDAALANLHTSIRKTFQLYLQLLQLFIELARKEDQYRNDLPKKLLNKNTPFYFRSLLNVPFIEKINNSKLFETLKKDYKISWKNENETLDNVFHTLKSAEEYKSFVEIENIDTEELNNFGTWLFREIVAKSDIVRTNIEGQNIYWADSLDLTLNILYKKIKDFRAENSKYFISKSLYKDEEEDKEFIEKLFRNVIKQGEEYDAMIAEKAKNWDLERIALIDTILLKMALTEIMHFPTIPPKVSINEYIDMSKDYSTPKSRIFINGLIDKLMHDLKSEGKVVKTGRGLIE